MKKMALIIFFLFPLCIFAKPKVKIIKGKDRIVYKKKTIINFEEQTVDGELMKPKGAFIQSRGRVKFNSLIQYRKDFLDNMKKRAKSL
jgi:hypothetical protein